MKPVVFFLCGATSRFNVAVSSYISHQFTPYLPACQYIVILTSRQKFIEFFVYNFALQSISFPFTSNGLRISILKISHTKISFDLFIIVWHLLLSPSVCCRCRCIIGLHFQSFDKFYWSVSISTIVLGRCHTIYLYTVVSMSNNCIFQFSPPHC